MGILTVPAVGSNGRVTLGQQTVYNRLVRPTHLIEFNSESIQLTETSIEGNGITGDYGRSGSYRGNLDIAGDIAVDLSVSGYGLLLHNALGVNYVRLPRVDGGYHARLEYDLTTAQATNIPDNTPTTRFIEFAPETVLRFPDVAGQVKFVRRDGKGIVVEEVSATAGYTYTESQGQVLTYATAVNLTGGPPPTGMTIELAKVLGEDGIARNADLATAGVLYLGPRKARVRYTSYTGIAGDTGPSLVLTIDPADITGLTAADYAIGALVTVAPGLLDTVGAGADKLANQNLANVVKGSFALFFHDPVTYPSAAYDKVFTHYVAGSPVPAAGFTTEVDRDAAVFLYSGMKVGTAAFNFEPGSTVTATFSLQGIEEFSIAKLVEDAIVGATSIRVTDALHFPNEGTISVGGSGIVETGITYTGKVDNGDGTYTLTGIPATGANSIQYPHRKDGSNVDLRTSTALPNLIAGTNTPLVPFESTVYVDGMVREVLNASITVDNMLNGDKRGLGSRARLGLVSEGRTTDATLGMEFDDGESYRAFLDGRSLFIEMRCVSEGEDQCGNGVDETGILDQMYFLLPNARLTGTTPVIEGRSYLTVDVPVQASIDKCYNNPDIIVIAVNRNEEDFEDVGAPGAGI